MKTEAARLAALLQEEERAAASALPDPQLRKEEMLQRIRTVYDIVKSDAVDYETKGSFMRSIVEKIVWDRATNTLSFYLYCADSKVPGDSPDSRKPA